MTKPLTFAEIAANGALEVPEAIALVLAVAEESARSATEGQWRALPSAEDIVLSASGRVSLGTDNTSVAQPDHVKMLAGLLRSLLGVDDQMDRRPHTPGGLLVLIARATGTMDLPVPSYASFRGALLRFRSSDEPALSAIYWRTIAQRATTAQHAPQPGTVVPLRAARPSAPAVDRRVHAPRPSDLRREVREIELELFRALHPTRKARLALNGRIRSVVAGMLATAALAASFMIGLNIVRLEYLSRDASIAIAKPEPPATRSQLSAVQPGRDPSTTTSPAPALSAASDKLATPAPSSAVEVPPSQHHGNAAGISARPVLSASSVGTDVFSPSFIEQGRALLFHSGRARSSLMRLSLDDRGHPSVATVLQDGAANYHAVRSPDGKWLAYDSDRDGTRAVYVAQLDGQNATKVSGDGYAAVPRWSPDGQKLAFVKAEPRRPRVWNVWVADLPSHSLTRVSHHAVGQAWSASWFPGGTRLAYSVENRLIIADLERGTSRSIASPRSGHLVRTPAVSPDGKWIVFQVHRDGAWLLQVATGKMHRVLADATAEEFAWSPDSRRIVYHTHRNGGWSLWQLALDRLAA